MSKISFVKGYLIYLVCASLAGLVAGAIQGGVLGFILGLAGVGLDKITIITAITGFLVGTLIGYFIFRWAICRFILPQFTNARQAT